MDAATAFKTGWLVLFAIFCACIAVTFLRWRLTRRNRLILFLFAAVLGTTAFVASLMGCLEKAATGTIFGPVAMTVGLVGVSRTPDARRRYRVAHAALAGVLATAVAYIAVSS